MSPAHVMFWGMGALSMALGAWFMFGFGEVLGAIKRLDKAKRTIRSFDDALGPTCAAFLIAFGALLWSLT